MNTNKDVLKTAITGIAMLIAMPIVVSATFGLVGLCANLIEKTKIKKKIKDGSVAIIDGEYYEVVETEEEV